MIHKKAFSLMVLIILISLVLTPLTAAFSYAAWLDMLFTLSLLATIIGAGLLVIEKGFFDPFIKNFKRFMRTINKRRQMADEVEQKNAYSNKNDRKRKYMLTLPLLEAGCMLFVLSTCLSIIQ